MTFHELCESLETKIQESYEKGVTLEQAEKLAGEFLYAQLKVSEELKKADLDSRTRKSGLKSIRAAVRLNILDAAKDKKPTEGTIEAMLDSDKIIKNEQDNFDLAEVDRNSLERYYDIFSNAHVHYRTIAKGRFD